MAESAGEKTEEATPKRLREARKKGQVPKSKDVSTIAVLLAIFGVIAMGMGAAMNELRDLMKLCFSYVVSHEHVDGAQIWTLGKACLLSFGKIILPIALVGGVVAFFVGYMQVGSIFAMEPLKPQMKKLNAIEGMKNMFKTQTFIELAKNIAKIFVIFYLAYSTINKQLYTILQTATIQIPTSAHSIEGTIGAVPAEAYPIQGAATLSADILFSFILKVLLAFLVISVVDFMIQKKQFMKQMRMTKDEVKREYKQDEGDPHIKGHRKQMHREFAFGDAKAAVKQSDVVVANSVHVAVAMKYDRETMVAPEIMIKGQRAFAEMIKQVATDEGIPIMRNIPLAWALFEMEEGAEIPEELYNSVAEVLAYVYRMKEAKKRQEERGSQIHYA
ncbi:MAG: EscU/YscU/HrcU family type III secretion system export apparatus switch protein [Deltaproteobacteria bacterium]|nr:EscU/YscU/HrcU family type III secretion system export apparatus switch protein [Deltaproteobacteria bacterium]